MFEYINILTMSMFFISLYIIFGNWNGNKSKQNFLLFSMLTTIIICRLFFITYEDTNSVVNISYTYEVFIILFAIILKNKYTKGNKIYRFIFTNYFVGLISIIIYSLNINYIYKQLISMYTLMATLYVFYMFNKSFNRLYKTVSGLYFMHISASLLLNNTLSLINVGYVIDLIFSILLVNDVLKIKINTIIRNNINLVEKIDNQNEAIYYSEDKFNTNRNITETLNERLIKKENLLETILGESNKCVLVIDNNGYIVNEYESFSKIWNEYKDYKDELKLIDFLDKNIKSPNKFISYVNEVNELGISIDREFEGIDGRIFKCTYSPCKVINNNLGTICYIEDITYSKKSEIEIIENEAKYNSIVDNIPYPIILTDKNRIIYDNQKYENVNLSQSDIRNLILSNLNEGEINYTNEEKSNIYLNIDREKFSDNESNKNLIVIRDITQYKKLLEKVKYSKQKYESLVNLIPEGIYILDFETQALSYANDVFLDMANSTSKEEIRLEKISEGMVINSINSNDSIKFCRKTIKNKNNQEVHIECGGMVIDVNKKLKVVGVIRDITEQVKSEQIEIEIEKKKIEYKNKNEFFVNMSHELKTPINLILSSNQLLENLYKEEIINNPESEITDVVNTVKQNSYFAMGLVDNIMELCKLEQDFHQYSKDYYNIVDIIEEICVNFNKYIAEKNIDIVFDTDEEEKILNIDPDDIEKVILTLLSSIIRYSESDSLISVDLKNRDGKEIIEIKNRKGYNYNKYNQDLERRSLDIAIDVAKQIIELYNGNINIKTCNDESIIVTVEMIAEKSKENYKERTKLINEDIIYSDYIRMCNF